MKYIDLSSVVKTQSQKEIGFYVVDTTKSPVDGTEGSYTRILFLCSPEDLQALKVIVDNAVVENPVVTE